MRKLILCLSSFAFIICVPWISEAQQTSADSFSSKENKSYDYFLTLGKCFGFQRLTVNFDSPSDGSITEIPFSPAGGLGLRGEINYQFKKHIRPMLQGGVYYVGFFREEITNTIQRRSSTSALRFELNLLLAGSYDTEWFDEKQRHYLGVGPGFAYLTRTRIVENNYELSLRPSLLNYLKAEYRVELIDLDDLRIGVGLAYRYGSTFLELDYNKNEFANDFYYQFLVERLQTSMGAFSLESLELLYFFRF